MAKDRKTGSYKGQQAGQWADSSSGKAAQTTALGVTANWDQECRKVSPDPGLRKGGMNRWSTEAIESSETVLYDTLIVDTRHYTFVPTHRMYNEWTLM